jgi:hypothetical protein
MKEILSAIESPRYLLVHTKAKRLDHWHSYACPSILATNKQDAELLRENLSHLLGPFELIYTHNAPGLKTLWMCSTRSYVSIHNNLYNKLATWLSGG